MSTQDPREGCPSASGIQRIMLCPGSWRLEQTVPVPPQSEDAAKGSKIHEAIANDDLSGLSDEDAETALKCLALEAELLESIFAGEDPHQTVVEERLWIGEPRILSGQADRIHLLRDQAIVIDWKTGRLETSTAEKNPQLRTLAMLVAANFPEVSCVTVAIIQPWVSPQVSVSRYGPPVLSLARGEIIEAIHAAMQPDAPRIPGEKQCKYCRALAVCPEALGLVHTISTMTAPLGYSALSPVQVSSLLSACNLAEDAIAAFRSWAKGQIEADPSAIPNWRLKPGSMRSTIVDVPEIYGRLKANGVTPEKFAQIVKVTQKDLKTLVREHMDLKGKALDEAIDTLLEGCTEEKQTAPSLERIKG